MRRVLPYFGAALAALTITCSAKAGSPPKPFADVPPGHWAYQAVTDLQNKGIILGYVDGYFYGRRTLTRYEFAVALKRALDTMMEGPGSAGVTGVKGIAGDPGPKGETGPPGDMGVSGLTPAQIDEIIRLTDTFQKELGRLGMDVRTVMTRLDGMEKRVDDVEQTLKHMVKFKGELFSGMRTDISRYAFHDYSGAMRTANNSFFNRTDTPIDFHLEAKAHLPGGAKFESDMVFSNYWSYRSPLADPAILFGGPSTANRNGFPLQTSL